MAEQTDRRRGLTPSEPGAARLYALAAGGFLALLGVLGFFFDAGFATGHDLAADDVAGTIVVNGWRNVVYLASGLLALGFASRQPRRTAAALGAFYLVFAVWGLIATDHDIGSILELLPLTDADNVLHLVIGALGALAAIADGPLPRPPGSRARTLRPAAKQTPAGGQSRRSARSRA